MALPSFTVTGTLLDLLGNVAGGEIVGNGLGGATPATVTFTSNVPINQFVRWDGDGSLHRVPPVVATVNGDGEILRNGDPVKLLAEDSGLSVSGLQWTATATGMKPFPFWAPADGGTVDLGSVAPAPNVAIVGIASLPVSGLVDATAFTRGFLTDSDDAAEAREYLGIDLADGDEIDWYANFAAFPPTGVTDQLYGARDTGDFYRWTGSVYVWASNRVLSTGITDSGTAGRAVVQSETKAAARDAINAQRDLPAGHYTPTGKPNGAITQFDSGQTVYTFGGSVGQVVSGEIVHTPTGVPSATYYEMDTGDRVWRMGCQVKWPANALGAATLVLPITPWGPPGGHPSGSAAAGSVAGIHLSVFGNGVWYNSRWNVGTQTIYADYTTHGRFPTIWNGEFHDVEVWIDPDKGTGRLFVDGWSSKVFSHASIAADTGNWAVWEQFNTNGAGDVPCVIRNMWVDTQERRVDTHVVTREDIAQAVGAVSSDAYDVATVTTSGGSTALTNDSATFQLLAGSSSHTMVLPTTDVPAGRLFIVQNASTGVITVNASGGGFVTALASGGTAYFISVASSPTTAGNWLALPLVTTTAVQTLTGKSLVSAIMRGMAVASAASAASVTPTITTANLYVYTALAANLTVNAPSGTPADGHTFVFRFKDNGTSRTLTWNAIYRAVGVPLPAATTPGVTMYVTAVYNLADVKWDVIDVKLEGVQAITSVYGINAQTGTTYTLALTDAGRLVTLNNAAAVTLTVPPNASVAFPVGAYVDLAQLGAGQVTIAPGAGVTLNSTPGLKIAAQYGGAYLAKIATDTWIVTGLLSA